MNAAPPRRPSGPTDQPGDEAPLNDDEAQLLGEVYATLHALLPSRRDDQELYELGRAVYAGAAGARAHLRRAGLPALGEWLAKVTSELRTTAHFREAAHVRALAQLLASWERRPAERRQRPR